MPADLTAKMDPNDQAANVYGMACPEHPEATRYGLAMPHAQNAIRKHNREQHAQDGAFQVGLMAALLLTLRDDMLDTRRDYGTDPDKGWAVTFTQRRYQEGLAAWLTLLGLQAGDEDKALQAARQHAQAGTVAHVSPF